MSTTIYAVRLRSDMAARWGDDPIQGLFTTKAAAEAFLHQIAETSYGGSERFLSISTYELEGAEVFSTL